jgi:hypothetical protein
MVSSDKFINKEFVSAGVWANSKARIKLLKPSGATFGKYVPIKMVKKRIGMANKPIFE